MGRPPFCETPLNHPTLCHAPADQALALTQSQSKNRAQGQMA